MFVKRTSLPEKGNKFYNTKSAGGWSTCIVGKPTKDGLNVLSNCVGWACSRYNEIVGEMKYPSLNCNAENFIERAKKTYNLEVVDYPVLGGIMVFKLVLHYLEMMVLGMLWWLKISMIKVLS